MPTRREFLAAGALAAAAGPNAFGAWLDDSPTMIVHRGKITTLDPARPEVSAVAIRAGRVLAAGTEEEILPLRGAATQVIDLGGRRAIPGLNDSHLHVIRGGLNYNMELRWDGVSSLGDALAMLREQARRTPPPQWVRVVGGWSEFQFRERRMPTLAEVNEAASDTPVFILHLYDRALLNAAALRAVGYTRETPDPPGGRIERDRDGQPTGLLVAKPNAYLLYKSLGLGPKLEFADQVNSTRHFLRELNRLGVTSIIDAGGGFQNYPEDYQVIETLHREGWLTARIAYNLFTQNAGQELADFTRWSELVRPYAGDEFFRMNGAGEMLVFSAADFEDFLEPRPDLPPVLEAQLEPVVRLLVEQRWPFRLHATYDESITRFLNVFERVNRARPFDGLRWCFDHAETISERNIERVQALGGGIAVQHRMAFQGEYFIERYGVAAAGRTPPIRSILQAGVPLGAGTDGTRVASYNPWVALYWLVSGRTVGGTALYPMDNRLNRAQALRLYTAGSAWFSAEEDRKGVLAPGKYADLAVLSADYFAVPEEEIQRLTSVLTIVAGRVVHGADEFAALAPPLPPPSPDWSPVLKYGGYGAPGYSAALGAARPGATLCAAQAHGRRPADSAAGAARTGLWGAHGCDCLAF